MIESIAACGYYWSRKLPDGSDALNEFPNLTNRSPRCRNLAVRVFCCMDAVDDGLEIKLAVELHVLGIEILRYGKMIEHGRKRDALILDGDCFRPREKIHHGGEAVGLR